MPRPIPSHRVPGERSAARRRATRTTLALGALLAVAVPVALVPDVVAAGRSRPANPAPATSASVSQTLTLGQRGPEVIAVQEALLAAGIPVVGGADGYFGQMTAAAVRAFQSERGLEVTGVVDAATAEALGVGGVGDAPQAVAAPAAPTVAELVGLAAGNVGPRVRALQEALIAAGIDLYGGADGLFGPRTETAVSAYQEREGLPVTGVVDEATARALLAPDASPDVADSPLLGLAMGARGPAVARLQEALLNAGLRFSGGVDGIFGLATESAVRQFQTTKGLPTTGTVDPTTAAALSLPTGTPAATPASTGGAGAQRSLAGLAPGTTGSAVRALQRALIDAGIDLPGGADGIFGPATAAAVEQFQRSRDLPATGRVDAATSDALASGAPAAPAPTQGDGTGGGGGGGGGAETGHATFGEQGERVRALQRALIDAGIDVPGGADGVFGPMTAGAVMTFQRDNDLPVTGVVDDATAAALGLTPSPAPPPPSAEGVSLDVFPMQGRCHFGDTWHAPRGGGRLHEGVDILGAEGKLIYAVTDGRITHVYRDRPGSRSGNGLRLEQPDGTYFFYAHLQSIAEGVEVGTEVSAGEVLGTNGSTGNAGTPHLHFEIHPRGGAPVNPYPLVKAIDACDVTEPLG